MKEIEIEVDGRKTKAKAQKINGVLWAHFNGQTYAYQKEKKSWGSSSKSGNNERQLKAPMPGKVVKVLFEPGQNVEANTTVIVMEAMKMEYSLKAPSATQIEKLMCKAGDQVTLGQVLCEFTNKE